ncbi:MAG: hypothetical protein ACU836_17715 [Gammaproteobacteria bacterium]
MAQRIISLFIALFLAFAPVALALGRCAMTTGEMASRTRMAGFDLCQQDLQPQFCIDQKTKDHNTTVNGSCDSQNLCSSHFQAIYVEPDSSKTIFQAKRLPDTPYRVSLISQTSPPEIKPPINRL